MEKDKVNYLIEHFLYLLPPETKSKLKYPYLSQEEVEVEKKIIAEIIFKDFGDHVLFNNCPKCKKLARTPKAKQCRYCGYNWH